MVAAAAALERIPIPLPVIASAAKQSRAGTVALDCFVAPLGLLAMTALIRSDRKTI